MSVGEKNHSGDGSLGSLDDEKHVGTVGVAVLAREVQALAADIEEAMAHADTLSHEDVEEALRFIHLTYSKDPNFPSHTIDLIEQYFAEDAASADSTDRAKLYEELKVEAALVMINSPYSEVRAVVSSTDDPAMPSFTIRAFVIGMVYVCIGAFINQFFSIRKPNIYIDSNVAQLLAYPAGKFFEKVLPDWSFAIPFTNERLSLNPGPFNMKEHMVITIMANVGFKNPYTVHILWVQYIPRFFNQRWASNFGYQLLTSLSTNFIGYGIAGLTRRFLVYPVYAIWPKNLAIIALNKAFHTEANVLANGWKISRMRFFLYVFGGMFVYFWFPNYIMAFLSYFNWMTWIAPKNVLLGAVTGSVGGLGLNPIPTFDYNQLTALGTTPLITPYFATVNIFFGALLTLPIILAIWMSNVWYTGHLPINSNAVFDNTAGRYNVSLTVNADALFDPVKYAAYSPAYLTAGNILLYGFFFAIYSATLSHAYLYHRHAIVAGFKDLIKRKKFDKDAKYDVHGRLMASYKEVPEWHYAIVLALSVALGAAGVGAYPTHTSPAVVLYGIFLALIFMIPAGIILAVTNVEVTLNVIAEFFGGLWFPGNATAMNYFKSYGYMVATFASTFVSLGILNFQMTGIENVCDPHQKDRFVCPGENTFFTASVLWGTLGPARMFGAGAIYNPLIWCFLIGFVLPFPVYYLKERFHSLRYFHLPVFFSGALSWAPYNLSNVWPQVPLAWFFMVYIRKRALAWWSKYNYVMASALACGIAISGIVQFFALQYSSIEIDWVPNTISFTGCDSDECPYFAVPERGFFGPGVGEFS
ncbi:OPT-domain-containing protein [Epithele typhae]|uniref:OPT-domain-containing protein n=1 Tax=Epithele typhae TaxID=378194 RepID=UPI00200748D8|nr:OPT-domain-containing protein [Epithele typhae]KAH9917385.1 OPT-domain-containing protein [Epithele typhae]